MRITDSILGALGVRSPEVSKEVLQGIRNTMLDELGRYDTTAYKGLFMKLYYADSVDKLWDLRTDLFPAMKEMQGDELAGVRMGRITELFVGYHSAAKKSKFPR